MGRVRKERGSGVAFNLRRGFFRLWTIGSVLWVMMSVFVFWEEFESYISAPASEPVPDPDPYAAFISVDEQISPLLNFILLAVPTPTIAFAIGLAVIWIYKGFTASNE